MKRVAILSALALAASPASAQTHDNDRYAFTQLPDPAKEAKARGLMEELRCLVCQGQSIAGSDADMAADMRALVRERIDAGQSPSEVREWLIDRYGDYVTYDPPFDWKTAPLWLAPILFLLIGAALAMRSLKRRRR